MPEGGFTPPEDGDALGPRKRGVLAGAQVRLPLSELKAYLAEKLAYESAGWSACQRVQAPFGVEIGLFDILIFPHSRGRVDSVPG